MSVTILLSFISITISLSFTGIWVYNLITIFHRYMGGAEVPDSWRGALNITYRYGGQLKNLGWYVRE
jgi:hypothetical protein